MYYGLESGWQSDSCNIPRQECGSEPIVTGSRLMEAPGPLCIPVGDAQAFWNERQQSSALLRVLLRMLFRRGFPHSWAGVRMLTFCRIGHPPGCFLEYAKSQAVYGCCVKPSLFLLSQGSCVAAPSAALAARGGCPPTMLLLRAQILVHPCDTV